MTLAPGDAVDERSPDVTRLSTFRTTNPNVVAIDAHGQATAVGDGTATIEIVHQGQAANVAVEVRGAGAPISFRGQVAPILSKAGCNAGACHASQYGKGGFKLSVFGFEPHDDHSQIVRAIHGRRINMAAPDLSLFLRKPTLAEPHKGGKRLETDSADYRMLRAWITDGAPRPKDDEPAVVGLEVFPRRRVAGDLFNQQLRAIATYADGSKRDVTHWSKFDSQNEAVVKIDGDGFATIVGRGQGDAIIRFEGIAAIATFVVPYAASVDLANFQPKNFIDQAALAKLQELGLPASPECDDATFLRRAFLDAIGTTPTAEEAAAFLDSTDPDKRAKLVDRLLGLTGDPAQDVHNDAYAAHWSTRWADLLRCTTNNLGSEQSMWSLSNWLKDSFRQNMPLHDFARELLTATGSPFAHGPANYFRVSGFAGPQEIAETTAQVFLGTRLACAKCHNHPYEKYSQTDYYGFAAFFVGTTMKPSLEFGLFGQEVVIVNFPAEIGHPKTGKIVPPTPLGGEPLTGPLQDRRVALADWLSRPDNPAFARNIVNRYFAHLFGRGLIEPVDDLRASNPPTNPQLLEALTKRFIEHGYDTKKLLRDMLNSRLYQASSQPLPGNLADDRHYSRFFVRRLQAEPLLDAVDAATGVRTKFAGLPLGIRAIEVPDADKIEPFLKTFGKPMRRSVNDCERVSSPSLAQALGTLNGEMISQKIASPRGRIAKLLADKKPESEIVTELYLSTLARRPTADELALVERFRGEAPDAKEVYEDLLWSLLNTKRFLCQH